MKDQGATLRAVEILVVEESPGDIRLRRAAIDCGKIQSRLNVVNDGDGGLDFLHQHGHFQDTNCPDLIILDLHLPRRSGLAVLADIKGAPTLSRIPVVIITSSKSKRDINRSYHLHANCCITKLVGADRFTEVVNSIEQFWGRFVCLPAR